MISYDNRKDRELLSVSLKNKVSLRHTNDFINFNLNLTINLKMIVRKLN